MVSYLFGGDTGETPESLKRKRDIAEAMIANRRTPQNVGEGLQAIGNAIMYRKMMSDIGAKEKSGLASADAAWSGLFGGGASTPGATGGSIPMPEAAGEVSATTPGATSVDLSGDKQTFIDSLLPAAMEESKRTGVDPRIIVAQAAQETGWGKSAPGNNFFGIKSHGQDGGNSMMTTEVIGGKPVRVRDSFRAYSSPADSVRGYGDFILQNPRYSDFRSAQGLDAQLSALQASGYATDPNYSRSVGAIARGIQLPQDVAAATPEAAFSAVMPEIGGGIPANADPILRRNMTVPSLSDEVAAFRGTPEHLQAYPAGYTQPDGQRQETPALPSEFSGSQQLKSAMDNRQGIVQALLGGSPASQEQIAQARNVGTQQQQTAQGPLGLDPRMLEALSNPFLSDGRKAVLKALIEQQMGQQQAEREMRLKQADPAYQVGLEKSRLELEALRNPKADPMKIGQGETVVDPATGKVIFKADPKPEAKPSAVQEYEYAKEQGFPGTFQDWEASKKGGMSLQVDPATGAVTFQQGGNIKPMTEGQSKDAVFSTRAAGALPLIDEFGDSLTGVEGTVGGTVGQLPVVGNFAKSEGYQKAEQAGKEFLQAILRKDTGAAITPQETNEYGSVYLPRPGDSPALLAQKKASRLRALEAIKAGMPPQAILAQEKALANTAAATGEVKMPDGMDPEDWKFLTPEERRLFAQ